MATVAASSYRKLTQIEKIEFFSGKINGAVG